MLSDHKNNTDQLLFFLRTYIQIEKKLLAKVKNLSADYCRICQLKCCKEVYCRESMESSFLNTLISFQQIQYDPQYGWLTPHGCQLAYGRPLVCYEFFCSKILLDVNFKRFNLLEDIREFISIGNRIYGNTHLICVENLRLITPQKLIKIQSKMEIFLKKISSKKSVA